MRWQASGVKPPGSRLQGQGTNAAICEEPACPPMGEESPTGDVATVAEPCSRHGPVLLVGTFLALALEGMAKNIAQRSARIGRAVLGNGFLFLGHFERLDRNLNLSGAAVELGHAYVDLLADGKSFRPLFGAITGQFSALDEGGKVRPHNDCFEAAFLDFRDLAGDEADLLDVTGTFSREQIAFKLLDAERNPLFFDIDIEHLGTNLVALLVFVDHLFARPLPIEIGEMDHAVHVAVETEEETDFRLVLDLAFDCRPGWVFLNKELPWIAHGLLETERDPALDRIDF